MKHKKPLILIDGSSYLFRAFHALPPLTNSKGEPTGAVYGVINMIKKIITDYEPEHIAVVFDPKGKTFRNDLYKDYKANRTEMPDELRVQIQPLFNIIKASGLPLIIVDGVEADDVIGTIAMQAKKQGLKTLISTGDKDMAQLVDDDITCVNTMTNKTMDEAGVVEKFGVKPKQIIDYLTLIGDTSDNVPGVQKVGPKTAAKWLNQYSDLDNLMAHADEIKGKVGEYFRGSFKQIPLSKQLVTIKLDIELPISIDELTPDEPDNIALIDLFKQLEFKSWLAQLLDQEPATDIKSDYQVILTQQDFDKWHQRLQQADHFAFDTETTDLNPLSAEVVGLSFALIAGEAAYVPLAHDYDGAPKQLDRDTVLAKMRELLADEEKIIIGQNLKYDMNVLAKYAVEVNAEVFDTMLEAYVMDSSGRHDMDSLALKYLGKGTIHFEDIAGKGAKQVTFNQIDIDKAGPYAAEDADITLQLHEYLLPIIEDDDDLITVLESIELPLMPVLARIERNGVLIDEKLLAKQSQRLAKRITELEDEACQQAGETFNLASTKQLQELFYDKLKLPILKRTPKGAPSTAEPVLQELALDYPLPKLILEHRSLSKLKSTYTDALPQQINSRTGRVHTSYNQAVTATGRLSSTDPNLQNIPARTDEGRKIRQAFIAEKNHKIVAADYSQIELRIMAHLSDDKGLKKAFAKGLDIHRATAAEVFGVALDDVTAAQRRNAKVINFGLIYGMSAFGLGKQLGIPRDTAQAYIDLYFSRYPGVKLYMDAIREIAREQGYVETLYGRRLYVPEINASNFQRRSGAERVAINAPMQGTAADIIKLAMIDIDAWLQDEDCDAKMIMQVHDELVFEVVENDVALLSKTIKNKMENAAELEVPLVVAVGVGDNWDEAH